MDLTFNKNEDFNKKLCYHLRKQRNETHLGGGKSRIDKEHSKGKLTARERIKLLLDSDQEPKELIKEIKKEFPDQIVELQERIIKSKEISGTAGITRIILGRSKNLNDINHMNDKGHTKSK